MEDDLRWSAGDLVRVQTSDLGDSYLAIIRGHPDSWVYPNEVPGWNRWLGVRRLSELIDSFGNEKQDWTHLVPRDCVRVVGVQRGPARQNVGTKAYGIVDGKIYIGSLREAQVSSGRCFCFPGRECFMPHYIWYPPSHTFEVLQAGDHVRMVVAVTPRFSAKEMMVLKVLRRKDGVVRVMVTAPNAFFTCLPGDLEKIPQPLKEDPGMIRFHSDEVLDDQRDVQLFNL